jgi:hypothetical protein
MSSGAKEILIKAVLQSISTYAMGVFKFPFGLIDDLEQIIRNFWWGDEENRRRMHWLSWDRLVHPKSQGGVGFRDLRIFNQALLARQAWRLLKFPNSLCASLLKAKYYPSGDLLDTAFIQHQSQSWQGVVHGLELLKKGIIWRIGNGTKVRIFRDNWIPRLHAMKVEGRRGTSRKRWVAELISPEQRTWNEAAVRDCCHSRDADTILSIRLSPRVSEDFLAWHGESNGVFSVRSAYRLGMALKQAAHDHGQSSSESDGVRRIWELIWKAKVPQKLRIFAWRSASGSLAVRLGLHRRMPNISPMCVICGMGVEDDHHALVGCTLARALREELRSVWSLPSEEVFMVNGKEWLLHLLSNSSAEMRPKVIFLLWRAWHHRNNIVHGDGKASISAYVSFLANYLTSFSAAQLGSQSSTCDIGTHWTAPEVGSLKANVDAGWDAHSKDAGLGIIVRDWQGKTILSEWKFIPNCGSAEEAEILACLEGLKHLINLRQWPAVIESDCLRAVQALTTNSPECSRSWALILEGRELLRVYSEIGIVKAERSCNSVTHVLAQLGKSGFSGSLSLEAPDCVKELIASDIM